MSATPTSQHERFYVTLDAPHASEPTQPLRILVYDVRKTPKRTVVDLRTGGALQWLMAPPWPAWTCDTVRIILWQMAGWLDGAEHYDDDAATWQWAKVAGITAQVQLHYRGKGRRLHAFELLVRLGTVQVRVFEHVEALTVPMVASLEGLPTTPIALVAVAMPASKAVGDDTDETLEDVEIQHRILRNLKEIAYFNKHIYSAFDQALEKERDKYGLDED